MAEEGENQVIVENNVKVEEEVTFNENVWVKSITLIVNLIINLFIFLTLFLCLLYVTDTGITLTDLHIILCVLGYQFFMWQGVMMISKYNYWSLFIQPRIKHQIHGVVHIIAVVLVAGGTGIAMKGTPKHFATYHGIFGLAALACCIISLLNGALSMLGHRRSWASGWMYTTRFFHYLTGIGSLFLATAALCYGFQTRSFQDWMGHGDGVVLALVIINCIITGLVALDFWIVMVTKIVNHSVQSGKIQNIETDTTHTQDINVILLY